MTAIFSFFGNPKVSLQILSLAIFFCYVSPAVSNDFSSGNAYSTIDKNIRFNQLESDTGIIKSPELMMLSLGTILVGFQHEMVVLSSDSESESSSGTNEGRDPSDYGDRGNDRERDQSRSQPETTPIDVDGLRQFADDNEYSMIKGFLEGGTSSSLPGYLSTFEYSLSTLDTINRLSGVTGFSHHDDLIINSEFNDFSNKSINSGLSHYKHGLKFAFISEPGLKVLGDLLVSPADLAVVDAVIVIGIANPIAGGVVAISYFAVVRPSIIESINDSTLRATIISSHYVSIGLSDTINRINDANREISEIGRINEADFVRFLMRYMKM